MNLLKTCTIGYALQALRAGARVTLLLIFQIKLLYFKSAFVEFTEPQ